MGVQTTVYAQNAWTLGAYKNAYQDNSGALSSTIGAGFGGCYLLRAFRAAPTDVTDSKAEIVLGPHLLFKMQWGPVFVAFDTLLGLTKQIEQHLTLNFQDVSHVAVGVSF